MPRFGLARRQQHYHRLADRSAARQPLAAFVARGPLVAEAMGLARRPAVAWSPLAAPAASPDLAGSTAPAAYEVEAALGDEFRPPVWAQAIEEPVDRPVGAPGDANDGAAGRLGDPLGGALPLQGAQVATAAERAAAGEFAVAQAPSTGQVANVES